MRNLHKYLLVANSIFALIGLYKILTHDYEHGLFLLLINGVSALINLDVLKNNG